MCISQVVRSVYGSTLVALLFKLENQHFVSKSSMSQVEPIWKKQISIVDRTAPSTFENKDKAISTPSIATHEFCSEVFGCWEHTSTCPKLQMIWFFFTCYTPKLILAGVPALFSLPFHLQAQRFSSYLL